MRKVFYGGKTPMAMSGLSRTAAICPRLEKHKGKRKCTRARAFFCVISFVCEPQTLFEGFIFKDLRKKSEKRNCKKPSAAGANMQYD